MAAVASAELTQDEKNGFNHHVNGSDDPFLENSSSLQPPHSHRFSSRFELDTADLGATSSPSQIKRVLEAHLIETERRLQDTHKLGTSLLQQQEELQDKLREVEQQQDEAEISPELKQRLASIGREHDDVSREIARSLLGPKSRAVSGEEKLLGESTTLTSQATGSPTKISAPNRRSRNLQTNRAGDLQFAADISTSLLAQVRQLQTAVAERDEALKSANSERSRLEQDVQLISQRLRTHDENEQKYKDENWNLQTQNHELLSSHKEATDKEKRLSSAVALAGAEKIRLLSEIEETKAAHSKATEDHAASKKAHETEVLGLKRDLDTVDSERTALQNKIDEMTIQNQELAKAMALRLRNQSPQRQTEFENDDGELSKDLSTPEHSPPPSPTKATPRHSGLESETLKSSLHHAHRMIQNLKSNIHREKTEKIELKRMLQEARDELEQRRNDSSFGGGSKKQKARADGFKKPTRPDMLGGGRRARTDIEMEDDDWEEQAGDDPSVSAATRLRPTQVATDMSDAYATAHETESNFETADERQTTESEAFETGVESLAGDSTDDLTETESTAPRSRTSGRNGRSVFGLRSAGSRNSYLSTASTSAGEEDDQLQTPVQSQPHRFRMRNGRSSVLRQTQIFEGTPDSIHSQVTSQDSPATVMNDRSPPVQEQSLFAELEDINDTSSNFSTPARSGILNLGSTPSLADTPSRSFVTTVPMETMPKAVMVDSATMTEPWQPEPIAVPPIVTSLSGSRDPSMEGANTERPALGGLSLPSTESTSTTGEMDIGTQYTPQRTTESDAQATQVRSSSPNLQYTPSRVLQDSPVRSGANFITPPKTVWDEEHESELGSPEHDRSNLATASKPVLAFSGVLSQETVPKSRPQSLIEQPLPFAYSRILSQQTYPIAPPSSPPPTAPLPAIPDGSRKARSEMDKNAIGAASGGILAGAAAALGISWMKDKNGVPQVAEDDTSELSNQLTKETTSPLQDISGNAAPRSKKLVQDDDPKRGVPIVISSNDQSSQTTLTAREIEQALQVKKTNGPNPLIVPTAFDTTSRAPTRIPELSPSPLISGKATPTSPPLRPSSASSHRSSSVNKQHPPLPSDYKTNIARANSLVQNNPLKRESSTQAVATVMGPPTMPASAMRRPKTPAESMRSPSRDNATPRVIHSSRQRSTAESQVSRRSSISSFASEIDQRFNIRAGQTGGYDAAPGTDPRMIQAITQTMIGEYLWKYTRKAGSKEMSTTRHRRYFWVHPYTKTLYWSVSDPSLPGAKESTSRSVPIESVRVVTDDNPMPPGLHRKSLEVTTPTRKVMFTASTGQRHETWFNALSYLLLRGEPVDTHRANASGENEVTQDDVDEFRVTGYDPHLVPTSRQSMSSYNSRTTTGTSKRVSGATGSTMRQAMPTNVVSANNGTLRHQGSISRNSSMPPPAASGRTSRADKQPEIDPNRTIRATSVSRVSRMLGSITGRSSRQAVPGEGEAVQAGHARGASQESNSIYNASVVSATRDSAEETRQEMLRQEAAGLGSNQGLENVRACCDGKHDVSTLTHSHSRTGERHGALSSMSDRINRSMSKRV